MKISSLAQGVNAPGLASLLKDAETQMKAGKFTSALDKYDDAEQVAPNNPLILMGRADALLGQSYYARAEQNLRKAFTQDQALLLGQYDLRSFLRAGPYRFDRQGTASAGRERTEGTAARLPAGVCRLQHRQ